MFTMIPMFIALGAMGWGVWLARSAFWQHRAGLLRGFYIFFWVVNFLALVVFSTYFPKQGRVEAMLGMRNAEYGMRNAGLGNSAFRIPYSALVVDGKAGTPAPMPLFYCGAWPAVLTYGKDDDPEAFRSRLGSLGVAPTYALVMENAASDAVVAELQQVFPDMQLMQLYESNGFDRFLHWLNPLNRTESVRLYRMRN